MKILISGASGLVGKELSKQLLADGHEVFSLVREKSITSKNKIFWDPYAHKINQADIEGMDAVIHLAGENVSEGRWTEDKKKRIRESRTIPTDFLAITLTQLENPPKTFISASAIGIYGNRPNESVSESSNPGTGFLAEVAEAWEKASEPAKSKGIRLVNARIAVVISKKGSMLKKLLLPFSLGLGGKLGDGKQIVSWIHLHDLAQALIYCLNQQSIEGPVNMTAPGHLSNEEITKALASKLKRPAFFNVPKFAARILLGEMADDLLFSSTEVKPEKLLASGFQFKYPTFSEALEKELGNSL